MVRTKLGKEVIEEIRDNAIIGYQNVIRNPNFTGGINNWTAASTTVPIEIVDGGVQITGSGQFYQNQNTTDVANGTAYMARVYCNTVSGTWKMLGATVASGAKASGAYSVSLAAGWNSARFDAGATHRINLTSTTEADTDTLICSPVEIRQQVDLTTTGQIRNLDVEFSGGTIDGTITVTSDITGSAALIITSDVTVGNDLLVASDAVISGLLSAGSLTVSGAITASLIDCSILSCDSLTASTVTTGNLIASTIAQASFTGAITVDGNASLVGSLNVAGATFTDGITFVTSIDASMLITDSLVACTLTTGDLIASTIAQASFTGAVTIDGNASVVGSINVAGATFTDGITAVTSIDASILVVDSITVSTISQTSIDGSITVGAGATVASELIVGGAFSVTPDAGNLAVWYTTAASNTTIDVNFGDGDDATEGLIQYDNQAAVEAFRFMAAGTEDLVLAKYGVSIPGSAVIGSILHASATVVVTSNVTQAQTVILSGAAAGTASGTICFSSDGLFYGHSGGGWGVMI